MAGRCSFPTWDRTFGGSGRDAAASVAIGASGAIYVAGGIQDGVDFGRGPRAVAAGQVALFVVKYAPDGSYMWDYVSPPATYLQGNVGVAVSPSEDRVYVAGGAEGMTLGAGDPSSAYVVALGSDGGLRSVLRAGAALDTFADIAADESGVVVVGQFRGSWSFDDLPLSAAGGSAFALARFTSDLRIEWGRVFSATGGTGTRYSAGTRVLLVAGETPEIVVGGEYARGGLVLGTTLPTTTPTSSFLARFDAAAGEPITSVAFASASSSQILGLSRQADGALVAAGWFYGGLTLGTETLTGTDDTGFLVVVEPDRTVRFARPFGSGAGRDAAEDVALDSDGNIVVVGQFTSDTDFGGGTRRPVGQQGFLAVYGPTGVHRSDLAYGSGGSTLGVRGVAIGRGNSTVITGHFTGAAEFGSGLRVANNGDGFVLRRGN